MNLGNCKVFNFASYEVFDINFSEQGLVLLYGPTGSGKSTIFDMPCWIMFGKTAKDGNADDVKSWQQSDEPTLGSLEVDTPTGKIYIIRIRGKSNENDLYWTEQGSDTQQRGKDLSETQSFLNRRLGIDSNLYFISNYISEYSPAGQFFTAKARDRRELFEQLANLELPIKLSEKSTNLKKELKNKLDCLNNALDKEVTYKKHLEDEFESHTLFADKWKVKQLNLIDSIIKKNDNFEQEKKKTVDYIQNKINNTKALILNEETLSNDIKRIQDLLYSQKTLICSVCHSNTSEKLKTDYAKELFAFQMKEQSNINNLKILSELKTNLKKAETNTNPYKKQLEQEQNKENPYSVVLAPVRQKLEELDDTIDNLAKEITDLLNNINSVTFINDLCTNLRAELLKKTVKEIERSTNACLEKHFDAEIRVIFSAEDADNLKVEIQNSGYTCNYKQLSKGQRSLLKLSFSMATLKAASNNAGIQSNAIFVDEGLDGLDTNLKLKAFNLFQELTTQYNTIMVIDHSPELQTLFDTKYKVTLSGGHSEITSE